MNNQPKFAFILEYVSDINQARQFYEQVLGLQVERVSPAWIQFSDHLAIGSDEAFTTQREPEVYYTVEDADASYRSLAAKCQVVLPLVQKPFGKVFGIQDPAGRPLYIVEFATNRPSQAVK